MKCTFENGLMIVVAESRQDNQAIQEWKDLKCPMSVSSGKVMMRMAASLQPALDNPHGVGG